ncbi:MAG: ATP-binding protein, partial [Patescibacteria group bacterium]|nr:ATP-binding protein [Patescibacteria group bacterium]
MQRIRKLDPSVIDQIAAGEVVERPASVVKEILDNAIDAGASKIVIKISGGGVNEICVQDDGSGIKKDDLELALESHATSKIQSMHDIINVNTLGFRGEALS